MLFSVLCATPAVVASAFLAAWISLSPEYDGQNQARIVYDAPSMKAFGYDGAFVSPTSESQQGCGRWQSSSRAWNVERGRRKRQ